MGDGDKTPLRLQFNPKVRLEFHGATITSDAGLLPIRELDDALGLTPIASDYLQESRTGRNIRHHLVPLLRQSIYSRLAGYDDTNDAERLSQDPAMRVVVGWQGSDRNAARTNTMSRFETETLTQEDNLNGNPTVPLRCRLVVARAKACLVLPYRHVGQPVRRDGHLWATLIRLRAYSVRRNAHLDLWRRGICGILCELDSEAVPPPVTRP